ncbi:hypothetical protein FQS96_14215 [Enterococcus faecalis]|uniref:hypothetical protein n=1 Tax=Enterococcus TaxID=1350 RepID=UPI001A971CEB|nr:hypothetical protein [Enterococcus faecalis]MBO1126592.1 hypothetical protein [Enterococcus faecalis]
MKYEEQLEVVLLISDFYKKLSEEKMHNEVHEKACKLVKNALDTLSKEQGTAFDISFTQFMTSMNRLIGLEGLSLYGSPKEQWNMLNLHLEKGLSDFSKSLTFSRFFGGTM